MLNNLNELYKRVDKDIKKIYVFPQIQEAAKYNTYLPLLYKELEKSKSGITVTSPHPLWPVFIVKKIFGEKSWRESWGL